MRWAAEKVHFEPGGKDHASPGGSYDTSSVIVQAIFDTAPPVFQGYEFVGIQGTGGKMSGSKGGAVSPGMLLDIYEPALLKWLYLRRTPTQSFNLAFDTEIYRQYDEFDRAVAALKSGQSTPAQERTLRFSGVEPPALPPIPFKQAVALGQITQWNVAKLGALLQTLGTTYDQASFPVRLAKARAWVERYNPDEVIQLMDQPDLAYAGSMSLEARARINVLRDYLQGLPDSIVEMEEQVYAIPKQLEFEDKQTKAAQRAFFKDVYSLLIGKDTGPRLSTFLWAVDRAHVLRLLTLPA